MKSTILTLPAALLALSAFAQAPAANNSAYPTRLETLLRRTGVVITSSSQAVGTVDGRLSGTESNHVTVVLRTEVISNADGKAKEFGLALEMVRAHESRSGIIYVDYDELDGLVAGINQLLELKPELPVVQAKYETRGGLIAVAYSTEKREVLGRLEISNDEAVRIGVSLDTLREFRDLVITAKKNLDLLKAGQ
jgi:hypothetical protein